MLDNLWDGTDRGVNNVRSAYLSEKTFRFAQSPVGTSILVLVYMLGTVCFVLWVSSWWESVSH